MKSSPIPFTSPMIRAILAGTKTQTRRILNPQPANGWAIENPPALGRITSPHPKRGRFGVFFRRGIGTDFPESDLIPCRYGGPGDQLWVKEAIRRGRNGTSYYDADQTDTVADAWPWKISYLPPMFCPQGLSRIALEIVSVRIERLQDISEDDARAEGAFATLPQVDSVRLGAVGTHVEGYRQIWESINGAGSWAANPLVWVLDFKRILPKEEPCHS